MLRTFLLIGQSNMVGKGCVIADLPATLSKPQEHVLFFHPADGWVPIAPGVTETEGFGPELSFGSAMLEALKEPIGIIKVSVGGTSLAEDWDPEDPNSLYARTLALVNQAKAARPILIVGIVWVQGGADARKQAFADAYADNLLGFIHAWQRDLRNESVAVVCGRCGTTPDPNAVNAAKPYLDTVRKAQMTLSYKRYACVDLDDISRRSDGVHFDAPGMIETGVRYAAAMQTLLAGK